MKKTTPKFIKMNLLVSLIFLFLSAVFITLTVIYIQPDAFRSSIRGILETPSLILLNGLPTLVLIWILYCLCKNVFASAAVTGLFLELLSYANLLKIENRNDPLIPSDIPLLRESLTAVGDYHLNLHPRLLVLILGSFLVFLLLAVFVRSSHPKSLWRVASGILASAVFVVSMMTVYPSKDYYNDLPGVDKSNVPLVFNSYGFLYCFLHNFNLYPIDKPQDYSKNDIAEWESETLASADPLDVNILFVMGEAFTDLPDEAAFDYSNSESPLEAYHQLQSSDQAFSGYMVASNVSAGTANTEFDVLTGMQTNLISEHTTSAFRAVHRNVDSLARVYENRGWKSWFMHPGQSWFYNRCNVYDYFGIEDQTFNDVFTPQDWDGSYITDQAFLRVLKELWTNRTGDTNTLGYAVTIENHQAYTYSKYASSTEEPLPTTVPVSDEVREQLSVYFRGVRHTSEMLLALTEFLDQQSEPTLLVFFGDHRPNLGADFLCYRAIGSDVGLDDTAEQVIYTYQTPYLIWANDALLSTWDMSAAVAALELPPENRISANYLGSLVYELTGMTGSSAYWDYLTQARRILPVICQDSYYLPDGTYTRDLTPEQMDVYKKLHCWQYHRLKYGLG